MKNFVRILFNAFLEAVSEVVIAKVDFPIADYK